MQELTEGEQKIIRALKKLEKLWKQHGEDLCLFNGNSLRKGGNGAQKEIATFQIIGDGGDGGDEF